MGNTAEPTTDDEIDSMISALEGGEAQEPEVNEEPEESSEQTEDSEPQEPTAEEEVQPGEQADESSQEEGSRVEELEQKLERLESKLEQDGESTEASDGDQASEGEEEPEQREQFDVEVSFEDEQFIDDETHTEALSNPETFNKFLASFAEDIAARTQEEILQKFPQIVDRRVQQRTRQEVVMQRFWRENEELKDEGKRKVLATKAQEVRSENPDLSLEETVQEAASRTREELDLGEKAEEIDQDAQENPAFAPDQGTGPSPSQEDTRDDQTKQIDEMIDAIG